MSKKVLIFTIILCYSFSLLNALNIPYQGSLEYKGEHRCGVVIISYSAFLTAANCIKSDDNINDFKVRAGTISRGEGGKVVNIKEIHIHPKFNNKTLDYDIAVIIPQKSFPNYGYVTEFIETIRIASKNENINNDKIAITSGWGDDENDNGFTETLMYLEIPILNPKICKKYRKMMTDRMICGGYLKGGKGTCHGDAGGPLVLDNKLIGIISRDDGCGRPNKPDLFTDVRIMKSWINQIIPQN